MNASSESGLCATVISRAAVSPEAGPVNFSEVPVGVMPAPGEPGEAEPQPQRQSES